MRHLVLSAALSLAPFAAAAQPTPDPVPSATPVVAAERAFAADFPAMGLGGSFRKWSTPDAVLIGGGGPIRSGDAFADASDVRGPDEPLIEWWPTFAGVAMSGEMGFTTGPAARDGARYGHYFTVWVRQADGAWRWVYDGGSGADAAAQPGPDSEPLILPTATVGSAGPEAAMAEVTALEAALASALAVDQKAAHLSALADDGRLYVAPLAPAQGRDAFAAALDAWPTTFEVGAALGGGASQAGDMVWTYGPVAWTRDGQARTGWYVRLWQKRSRRPSGGWRIVVAQLISAPPPSQGG